MSGLQPLRGPHPSRDVPEVGELDGRAALLLGGVVQSVGCTPDTPEPDGYWRYLVPDEAPRRVLMLGLGGGTVAHLLQRRFPAVPMEITGVEIDPAVLGLAEATFDFDLPGLHVVQAEAGAWLKRCVRRGERFDLVVVDLFCAGAVPGFVTHRRFLARVAAVLDRGGTLAVNLNRGARRPAQLRALLRGFAPVRAIGTGMNLVVRAVPLPVKSYRRRASVRQAVAASRGLSSTKR